MEPRGDRLAGQKGRAPEALGHFVEPMACLAVAMSPRIQMTLSAKL
jgi:hypothetical protein